MGGASAHVGGASARVLIVCLWALWQKSSICYLAFPDSYSGRQRGPEGPRGSRSALPSPSFLQDVSGTLASASGSVSRWVAEL